MTSKQAAPLVLDAVESKARKISNNLLNFGDEKVTAFTIPLEQIPLLEAAVDALCGKYTFRSWFNQDAATKLWSPMPWWATLEGGVLKLNLEIEVDDVEIIIAGRTLTFEHDEDSEGHERAIGKVSNIVVKAITGGVVQMSLHLQVRPGRGAENLALQDGQYESMTVTLGDTRLIAKKGDKQQQLPLNAPGAEDDQATRDAALDNAGNGNVTPIDGTTSKSRAARKPSAPAAH